MLWLEAMQHLQSGVSLESEGTALFIGEGDDPRFHVRRDGHGEQLYNHIMDAIDAFTAAVGSKGLRQAIAVSRYRVMFPCGSSLEWAPVCLKTRCCNERQKMGPAQRPDPEQSHRRRRVV